MAKITSFFFVSMSAKQEEEEQKNYCMGCPPGCNRGWGGPLTREQESEIQVRNPYTSELYHCCYECAEHICSDLRTVSEAEQELLRWEVCCLKCLAPVACGEDQGCRHRNRHLAHLCPVVFEDEYDM